MALLTFTAYGIYCPLADVYIDPWKPVDRALITHAHSDHSRWGMKRYVAHKDSVPVMRHRLGKDIRVNGVEYGERFSIRGVNISFHPAGHIIGSAQIRLEYQGEVWVVSGDYKLEDDGLSAAFEPVKCHTFITESTFGLPVYQWQPQAEVFAEINTWWAENAAQGKASLLSGYSLGKAQRILQGLDQSIGPVFTHGAVENVNEVLRGQGIALAPSRHVRLIGPDKQRRSDFQHALIIAPPGATDSTWAKRFQPASIGMVSGWMTLRGARRRRAADRGFILSDHADWQGLNQAIKDTGAETVFVTHGYSDLYAKWLREQGYDAQPIETKFEGETLEGREPGEEDAAEEASPEQSPS